MNNKYLPGVGFLFVLTVFVNLFSMSLICGQAIMKEAMLKKFWTTRS